jgi:DNA mismatch endonuclease (patch repair protein)
MSRVRTRDTAPEMLVRSILHRLGYRFRLHDRRLPGSPDIVLPRFQTVIFVHGCFWHSHRCRRGKTPTTNVRFWSKKLRRNKQRDVRVRRELTHKGWRVIVIWQCELRNTRKLESQIRSLKIRL